MKAIDLLLYGGRIITMDQDHSLKSWVAIRDGKIVDIGIDDGHEKYLKNVVDAIFLNGKTVIPGFYDSHVHLVQTGLNTLGIDLSKAETIKDVLDLIKKKSEVTPEGELVCAVQFDESKVREKRMPTRYELDECAPNNPVWINRIEYHTSIINSMAFNILKIPFYIEGIQRNEKNLPNGCLTGKASALVRNRILDSFSEKKRLEVINKSIQMAIEQGITSLNAMEGGFSFHNKDAEIVFKNKNTFPIDVAMFYQTVNVQKVLDSGLKRIGGGIFLDGTLGSRTAAISKSYEDNGECFGELYYTQEEIDEFILKASKKDLQISVHAIGNRAIDQIIKSYETIQKKKGQNLTRNRIEHFVFPTEEQIKKCAELGIIVSMTPTYQYFWGGKGGMYEKRLGKNRRQYTNPIKRIIESGMVVLGSSDSDITPISPVLGIHSAVNCCNVEVLDALKMYTVNGAYGVFEENKKGSIEIGKLGDLVILDENPLTVEKDKIKDIKVMMTIKEGNILHIG
ncbi:MAG: amidohydrolase [Marinisporobacter sp.]|jgi:predicted amidohydrolase YtcJ|nr:amidohydrolase [Marinisporobacter sp.]